MITATRFATPLLALALVAASGVPLHAQAAYGPPNYHADSNWDSPPTAYNDVQRKAFQDGLNQAHSDFDNHRVMDAHKNELYKKPPVEKQYRDQYRDGFERGYSASMSHYGPR